MATSFDRDIGKMRIVTTIVKSITEYSFLINVTGDTQGIAFIYVA